MMNLLNRLTHLDVSLFAELAKSDDFDEVYFSELLSTRADLLAQVIHEGNISTIQSNDLITRSRELKAAAEKLKQRLGEQLKNMNKGRRSVQAYQTVKRN